MERWMERQDGQDGWEYGMNHMDGKDEEEIDDKFFSFSLYIIFPFNFYSIFHSAQIYITFILFRIFLFYF